jgi:hypothetical protein
MDPGKAQALISLLNEWIENCEMDILDEAKELTTGPRNNQYGPPDQDFQRTADMWNGLFGDMLVEPFQAKHVAMAMIALKLSRARWMDLRDNWVDIAGYARCGHICVAADEVPAPQEPKKGPDGVNEYSPFDSAGRRVKGANDGP